MIKRSINKADVLDLISALGFDPEEVYFMRITAGGPVVVDFRADLDRDVDESVPWETAKPFAIKFVNETLGLDPDLISGITFKAGAGAIEVYPLFVPFYAIGGDEE